MKNVARGGALSLEKKIILRVRAFSLFNISSLNITLERSNSPSNLINVCTKF